MTNLSDAMGPPNKRGVKGALCIQREGKLLPPNVYQSWSQAKAEADRLTRETGVTHKVALVMDFSQMKGARR